MGPLESWTPAAPQLGVSGATCARAQVSARVIADQENRLSELPAPHWATFSRKRPDLLNAKTKETRDLGAGNESPRPSSRSRAVAPDLQPLGSGETRMEEIAQPSASLPAEKALRSCWARRGLRPSAHPSLLLFSVQGTREQRNAEEKWRSRPERAKIQTPFDKSIYKRK